MVTCSARLFAGVDIADRITTGLSQKFACPATCAADPSRFSNWLPIARQNFSWTQKTPAIFLSLAGRFQNQGLDTDPDSTGVPRLISRTSRLATLFAPEDNRNATNRITPARLSTAARRHTLEPISARLRSCSEGGFHSAATTGSTSTIPAVSAEIGR